jgi:heparanase 1
MKQNRFIRYMARATSVTISAVLGSTTFAAAQTVSVTPSMMPRVGMIDERYQSYNIEMLEVTGGKFWRPYGPELEAAHRQPAPTSTDGNTPAGMNPSLYEYRPPIDLTNARLRKLAAALGPAYVRVSGTWANTTYFSATDQPPADPPAGFGSVLTHQQWDGVIEFSKAVDARIVTSFANGVGTRDAAGVWTSEQAKRFLDYTASHGGDIAAAEFMNEPDMAAMGGAPAGYDAAAYGRDFKIFHAFARQSAPDMQILGTGSVGEATEAWAVVSGYGSADLLKTRDLLAASRPAHVDAFSYHHYGAASQRCAAEDHQTTPEAALSEDWLGRTDETLAFYRKLRDEFEPGRPFWVTETADAACGGNPWANTFLDSFRYLDQLGRLAKQDVTVVAHNTLRASDYGLLDDTTLEPKPNYWAGLLWRRLMGPTVLESGVPIREGLHLYAHCLRGTPGGVALLAINNSRTRPISIALPNGGDRYTLSAPNLEATQTRLNGDVLRLSAGDELPALKPAHVPAVTVELQPASITFLAVSMADNPGCR